MRKWLVYNIFILFEFFVVRAKLNSTFDKYERAGAWCTSSNFVEIIRIPVPAPKSGIHPKQYTLKELKYKLCKYPKSRKLSWQVLLHPLRVHSIIPVDRNWRETENEGQFRNRHTQTRCSYNPISSHPNWWEDLRNNGLNLWYYTSLLQKYRYVKWQMNAETWYPVDLPKHAYTL